jgi:ABC-type polysaccharide/polyol phosphate transport system ATPase subunit
MSSLVIEVNNVSKAYPVYSKNSDLLKELITGKKRHDEYWALKTVSFSLKEKQIQIAGIIQ